MVVAGVAVAGAPATGAVAGADPGAAGGVRAHQHATCIRNSSGEDLGRSRGGLTTNIHAVVDTNGLPIHVSITGGQRHGVLPACSFSAMAAAPVHRRAGAPMVRAQTFRRPVDGSAECTLLSFQRPLRLRDGARRSQTPGLREGSPRGRMNIALWEAFVQRHRRRLYPSASTSRTKRRLPTCSTSWPGPWPGSGAAPSSRRAAR